MTVQTWLVRAADQLDRHGIESARLEAQLLAALACSQTREWVLAHPEAQVNLAPADQLLEQRCRRVPLPYLRGYQEFYGRRFEVGPDVLIPRPESETLIDLILAAHPEDHPLQVVDLGTGSGCLGVTLALERPRWSVTLADVSLAALRVAHRNALALGATCNIVESDWLSAFAGRRFDGILSNPPYIAAGEPVDPETSFEPERALYAADRGLSNYQILADQARNFLKANGQAWLEIGHEQGPAVEAIFREAGWLHVAIHPDLGGRDRVIEARP